MEGSKLAVVFVGLCLAAWAVLIPLLVMKEIQSLDLPVTHRMSPEERQVHFLRVAFPELEENADYFDFLVGVREVLSRRAEPSVYRLEISPKIEASKRRLMIAYAQYHLLPNRPVYRLRREADVVLLYRKNPSSQADAIRIPGPAETPSFIVIGSK